MSACVLHPQGDSIPKSPGAPPAPDPSRISPADAEQYVSIPQFLYNTIDVVHVSFHVRLPPCYIESKMYRYIGNSFYNENLGSSTDLLYPKPCYNKPNL